MSSIFIRQLIKLVKTEYRAVLADILVSDVAASAFSYAALHAELHGGVYLSLLEAQLLQTCECELYHYRRSADKYCLVYGRVKLLDIVGNKSYMTVPALLGIVDSEVDLYALICHPLVDYLLVVNKVVL